MFNDNNARGRLTMNTIKTKLNNPGVKGGGMTLIGLLVCVGLSELAEAISYPLTGARLFTRQIKELFLLKLYLK